MLWEEEIKQALHMDSPHFSQPWENTWQTGHVQRSYLSHLSSNTDRIRSRKTSFLFTTDNKWAQFLDHYRLYKAAEQFSQPATRFLKPLLMKAVPTWKLNSLTKQLFIFLFFPFRNTDKCSPLKAVSLIIVSLRNVF